jgi:hypothetical protein
MSIDLNKEELRNFSDSTPFLPDGEGSCVLAFEGLFYHEGYRGNAYLFKWLCVDSDGPAKVGTRYVTRIKLETDKMKATYRAKDIRSIVAAVEGVRASDDFDANAAFAKWLKAGEDVPKGDACILVECVAREKTKDGKTYTNRFFNPVA